MVTNFIFSKFVNFVLVRRVGGFGVCSVLVLEFSRATEKRVVCPIEDKKEEEVNT
jgi:hypothetical protein